MLCIGCAPCSGLCSVLLCWQYDRLRSDLIVCCVSAVLCAQTCARCCCVGSMTACDLISSCAVYRLCSVLCSDLCSCCCVGSMTACDLISSCVVYRLCSVLCALCSVLCAQTCARCCCVGSMTACDLISSCVVYRLCSVLRPVLGAVVLVV